MPGSINRNEADSLSPNTWMHHRRIRLQNHYWFALWKGQMIHTFKCVTESPQGHGSEGQFTFIRMAYLSAAQVILLMASSFINFYFLTYADFSYELYYLRTSVEHSKATNMPFKYPYFSCITGGWVNFVNIIIADLQSAFHVHLRAEQQIGQQHG